MRTSRESLLSSMCSTYGPRRRSRKKFCSKARGSDLMRYLELGVVKKVCSALAQGSYLFCIEHTDPEYPKSPTATKSVRLFLLGLRKLSVYSSSSISHVSPLNFLKSLPRYLESARLKMAKNAMMRAKNPGRASSSCCFDPV
jgi:hypothetical protein